MASDAENQNLGRVWKSFCDEFTDADGYRWHTNQLMDRIEVWAKAWPDDVMYAGCDDACFASSDLWLICHRGSDGTNDGTTVVYIPQCTGEPPRQFFLYPEHTKQLIAALQKTLEQSVK